MIVVARQSAVAPPHDPVVAVVARSDPSEWQIIIPYKRT